MRARHNTMAHATVRTTEMGRLPDHAEHGFIPKDKTISAAAAWLWVATHNHARTIQLLKNVTSRYIAWNLRYKDKLIKIGAKVVSHSRYVIFQMAEVAVPQTLFRENPVFTIHKVLSGHSELPMFF